MGKEDGMLNAGDERQMHETECRIYLNEMIEKLVICCWKGAAYSESIYHDLVRHPSPRPAVDDCWSALTASAVDIHEYEDVEDREALYEVLEKLIDLVEVAAGDEHEGTPPDWPVRPEEPGQTLEWLSGMEAFLGLGSFAAALLSGVPVEDIVAVS